MIEIAVKLKSDDDSLVAKYLVHEEGLCLTHEDATLSKLVQETLAKFKGQPDDILIKLKYTW
jgi:hypothetical protein